MDESNVKRSYKKYLVIACVLLLSMCGVLLYRCPITFDKIVTSEEQNKLNRMSIWGNLLNDNAGIEASSDERQGILNTLGDYQYRRCIGTYDVVGRDGVFIDLFTDSTRWSIVIEIWDNGYIRIPNNKVYKLISDDRAELFNKINKLLEKDYQSEIKK